MTEDLPSGEALSRLKNAADNWKPKKKVFVATPSNRGISNQYLASLLNTMAHTRTLEDEVLLQPFLWPGESLISRARNDILRHFLASDCTHLFFIDDDIAWEPDCFFDLLAAEKDVIGGAYPLKMLRWDRLVGQTITSVKQAKLLTTEVVINGVNPEDPRNEGPIVVAQDLGTGFLCISRAAIERMIEAYPDDWYMSNARMAQREKTWNFFGTMIGGTIGTEDSVLLSEDYAFCRKWQNIGGLTYVHTGIPLLTHIGQYSYGRFDD